MLDQEGLHFADCERHVFGCQIGKREWLLSVVQATGVTPMLRQTGRYITFFARS